MHFRVVIFHQRHFYFFYFLIVCARCSGIAAAVLRAAAAAALRPEETRVITFKDLLKVRATYMCTSVEPSVGVAILRCQHSVRNSSNTAVCVCRVVRSRTVWATRS